MRIKYTGSGVHIRHALGHTWHPRQGHVTEVAEVATVQELLTMPGSSLDAAGTGFCIDDSEPLLRWLSPEQAAVLVLEMGVVSTKGLAALKTAEVNRAAELLEIEKKVVSGWVAEAKAADDPADNEEDQLPPIKKGG